MKRRSSGHVDFVYLLLVAVIVAIGLVMLISASAPMAVENYDGDVYHLVKRQIMYGLLPGAFLCWLLTYFDLRFLKRFYPHLYILSLVLLVSVFVPGLAADWGTSHSWLKIGFFSFQPVEAVKLTLVLTAAGWLSAAGERTLSDWRTGLLPFVFGFGLIGGLLILQPDMGGLMALGAIAVAMYMVAGAPWRDLAVIAAMGLVGIFALIKAAPYRLARLTAFLRPLEDPQRTSYHINQALLAVGSGGIFGLGFNQSRQKHLYLPEVAGDSIVAVMAEEMGLIFMLMFLGLYLALCLRGMKIAKESPDDFTRLMASGITAWFGFQAIINIGSMIGIMPMTGLPLPFVSHGGSALMMSLVGVGVMLSISRFAKR